MVMPLWQAPGTIGFSQIRGKTVRQHGCPERLLTVRDADGLDDDLRKQLAPTMEIFNRLGKAPPSGSVQCMRKIPDNDLSRILRR